MASIQHHDSHSSFFLVVENLCTPRPTTNNDYISTDVTLTRAMRRTAKKALPHEVSVQHAEESLSPNEESIIALQIQKLPLVVLLNSDITRRAKKNILLDMKLRSKNTSWLINYARERVLFFGKSDFIRILYVGPSEILTYPRTRGRLDNRFSSALKSEK